MGTRKDKYVQKFLHSYFLQLTIIVGDLSYVPFLGNSDLNYSQSQYLNVGISSDLQILNGESQLSCHLSNAAKAPLI